MLYQIHHQDKKGFSCEFVAQAEIGPSDKEMQSWCKEVKGNHPLLEGKQWLICNEDSKHFVKCKVGDE